MFTDHVLQFLPVRGKFTLTIRYASVSSYEQQVNCTMIVVPTKVEGM